MPRRAGIPRKSKYETTPVNRNTARITVKLMKDGKRNLADRILRQALARAEASARRPGMEVLEAALRNATPIIEVKPRRVGGATYQVPVEIRGDRRMSLGVRWLVQAARKRSGKSMSEKLAAETCATSPPEASAEWRAAEEEVEMELLRRMQAAGGAK